MATAAAHVHAARQFLRGDAADRAGARVGVREEGLGGMRLAAAPPVPVACCRGVRSTMNVVFLGGLSEIQAKVFRKEGGWASNILGARGFCGHCNANYQETAQNTATKKAKKLAGREALAAQMSYGYTCMFTNM